MMNMSSDGDYVTPVEELDREEITREFIEENVIDGEVVLKEEVKPSVSGGEGSTQYETTANKFRRMVIRDFLDDLFTFNPDKHVRSAYSRNPSDPERKKIKPKKGKKTQKTQKTKNLTREEKNLLEYGRVTGKIPPADLFHNFKYYMESNYDALRIATRDLYCEKPDLDFTIKIYDDFRNQDEYNDFVHKYEESNRKLNVVNRINGHSCFHLVKIGKDNNSTIGILESCRRSLKPLNRVRSLVRI